MVTNKVKKLQTYGKTVIYETFGIKGQWLCYHAVNSPGGSTLQWGHEPRCAISGATCLVFLAPLPLLPLELIQCVSKIPRRYDIYDITSPTRNIFSTNWPYILNFQLTIVKKFLN